MRSAAITALFALVAVQQAAATFGHDSGNWNDCKGKESVKNADNECTDQQKQSFQLATANLKQGACTSFGGFDISDMEFGPFGDKGARGLFTRTGGPSNNCLKGKISKSEGPKIACGKDIPKKKASISNFQVSVDKDTDVQFVHTYEGSDQTCSYTKKCTAGKPNSVDNSQCGGSTAVKYQLPHNSPHESCNIGVHAIQFDCTPGQKQSSSVALPPKSESKPYYSKPYSATVPIGTAPGSSLTVPPNSNSAPAISSSLPPASSPVPAVSSSLTVTFPKPSGSAPLPLTNSSSPVIPTVSASSPAPSVPASSPPLSAPGSSAPSIPVQSSPASSPAPLVPGTTTAPSQVGSTSSPAPSQSTVEKVTSEIVYSTVTTCDVTNTHTVGSTTSLEVTTRLSTVKITSVKTICTQCVAPPKTSSPPETQIPSSSPPAPPASSPAPPVSSAPSQVGSSSVPSPPASSPSQVESSSVPAPPASSPSQVGSSSVPAPPASSPPPVSSPAPPASSPVVPAPSSPSQVGSSAVPAPPPSSPPAPPQTTQEVVSTAVVYQTVTTCPITNTITPPHGTPFQQISTTIKTVTSTSISTICTKCVAPIAPSSAPPPASSAPIQEGSSAAPPPQGSTVVPPAVSSPAPMATSSAPPAPSPLAPGVLPSCVKTWLTITKCKDNSDYDCYCKHDTFTENVFECISAWEQEQSAQQAAFSFYAGICAPHVPEHPVIVTAIPSTVTLIPTPAATPAAPQGSSPAPPAVPGSPAPIQPGAPVQPAPVQPGSSAAGVPIQEATSALPAPGAPAITPAPGIPAPAPGVTSAPAASVPVQGTTSAPAVGVLPPTTISISTTVTLPCSAVGLATQISDGQVQAGGSSASECVTTSLLSTAVTVPQVAFTTGASSSVGLAAGSPAPAQAAATSPPAPPIAPGSPAPGVPGVAGGSSSAVVAQPTGVTPFVGAGTRVGPSSVVAVIVGAFAMAVFA